MKTNKPLQSTLELCDRAAEMIKSAGFILDSVSMKTETCYYRLPDRSQLLRISNHSYRRNRNLGFDNVVAKITFSGCHLDPFGKMKILDSKMESMVAGAIGRYFLNSSPERKEKDSEL